MAPWLGCIADDFTGGTDLAGMLVKHGLRTIQVIGVPADPLPPEIDAVVVALKSRTAPVGQAVAESLAALRRLQEAGCERFYFKYCSTFDSTPAGNIGPVAEALMDALGTGFTVVCPAFPANKRTIYKGRLFVGDVPLDESSMRHHPLTPMNDADLVRVMQAQSRRQVGLVDYDSVRRGAEAIRARFAALQAAGCGFAVVDALIDQDLVALGEACRDLPLVTAGSGLAIGLARNFAGANREPAGALPAIGGFRAVLAGSCSAATLEQIAMMRAQHPGFAIDPLKLGEGVDLVGAALHWATPRLAAGPVLIYASAAPDAVQAAQQALGAARAGALVEAALAGIAKGLVALGVERLIVAGGETSGAVVAALGVKALRIGPEIAPGVPWTLAVPTDPASRPLALALKSGNFGAPDFLLAAWDRLR